MRAAAILLFVVTAFLLTSLGGAAIMAAPITLPLLYLVVRQHPTRPFRVAGALIAALTVLEVAWAAMYVLVGETQPWIVVVPLLVAAATFVLYVRAIGTARQHAR